MIVDRAYLVVIQDRHSGAVLFMGKIVDPPPFR
jgi:serine protease inhibitor